MADTITEGTILAIGLEYEAVTSEGPKTRTAYLKVPNPRNGLTAEQIRTVAQQLISGEGAILRDAEGDPFDSATAVVTAYSEYTRTVEYDIGVE